MNKYFQQMRQTGVSYRKKAENSNQKEFVSPFSEAQRLAFHYWSIADRIHSTEIYLSGLPDGMNVPELLNVYEEAEIYSLVIAPSDYFWLPKFAAAGWAIDEECQVFSRETELYYGKPMIETGIRVKSTKYKSL